MPDRRLTTTTDRGLAVTDLAKRVGDDVTALAKNHFELARSELGAGLKSAAADLTVIILGGILALVGLAMLCVSAVVAAEPIVSPLWLRLFAGAALYIVLGALLIMTLVRRLRGEPPKVKRSREEVQRTAEVLKEQVQHG